MLVGMTATVDGPGPTGRITLVALLFVRAGREDEFEAYERRAFALIERHGGRLERRIRCAMADVATPYEVHVLSFPSAADFARYRADPDGQGLADLRARAIERTVVWPGAELPSFAPPG
jgi:uncharacterized protein (DUF1330 family)